MWYFVSRYAVNGKMQVPNADWQTQKNGGISAADEICRHDAITNGIIFNCAKCRYNDWKAMIVQTSVREAKPTLIDWVFLPNTPYYDAYNRDLLGQTNNEAIFNFPLVNSFGSGRHMSWNSARLFIWTGLNADLTTNGMADTCRNWTSDSYYDVGVQGRPLYYSGQPQQDRDSGSLHYSDYRDRKCDDSGFVPGPGQSGWSTSIVCVEQQ